MPSNNSSSRDSPSDLIPYVNLNPYYRGRVRTGCLACRVSKVRCDEKKPVCGRCARLARTCTYRTKQHSILKPSSVSDEVQVRLSECAVSNVEQSSSDALRSRTQRVHRFIDIITSSETCHSSSAIAILPSQSAHPGQRPDSSDELLTPNSLSSGSGIHRREGAVVNEEPQDIDAHNLMVSQDVYLCGTIDLLAAKQTHQHRSWNYFLKDVDAPALSPFDPVDWQKAKARIVELGEGDPVVATAITALQELHKRQIYGLITPEVIEMYHSARDSLNSHLDSAKHPENARDCCISILISTFLLSLFEIFAIFEIGFVFQRTAETIPQTLACVLGTCEARDNSFVRSVCAWLLILHATTRRGGGKGILPEAVLDMLWTTTAAHPVTESTLMHVAPDTADLDSPNQSAAIAIYENLTRQMFHFYLTLTKLGIKIADQAHYHRSRITPDDQAEANTVLSDLKARISEFWASRPPPMRLQPDEIRTRFQLPDSVTQQLVTHAGLCMAACWTEIVEIGRVLSDPPLASPEAKHAMRQIRAIIDGDWGARTSDNKIHAGYLRPLFLCAIESIQTDDAAWAVRRMREIRDPIGRSDFFAAFGEGLAEAQRDKARRVTTRWFCYQAFGVQPPPL